MQSLLLLAPLAWFLLAQAKDDGKLEGEGAAADLSVPGRVAEEDRGVQATWAGRAGELGCGHLSTCPRVTPIDHFLSWSRDS